MIGTYPCEAISVLIKFHTDWPLVCIVFSMESKKKIERFEDLIVWPKTILLAEEILTFDVNNVMR